MKLTYMEMRGRSANVDSKPQECADYLARSTEYSGQGSRPEYDKGSLGRRVAVRAARTNTPEMHQIKTRPGAGCSANNTLVRRAI